MLTIGIVSWSVTQGIKARTLQEGPLQQRTFPSGDAKLAMPAHTSIVIGVSCADLDHCCPRATVLEGLSIALAVASSLKVHGVAVASTTVLINSSLFVGGLDGASSPKVDDDLSLDMSICRSMPPGWYAARRPAASSPPTTPPSADIIVLSDGSNVTVSFGHLNAGQLARGCPTYSTVMLSSSTTVSLQSVMEREAAHFLSSWGSHAPSCIGRFLVSERMEERVAQHLSNRYVDVLRECRSVQQCREQVLPWFLGTKGFP